MLKRGKKGYPSQLLKPIRTTKSLLHVHSARRRRKSRLFLRLLRVLSHLLGRHLSKKRLKPRNQKSKRSNKKRRLQSKLPLPQRRPKQKMLLRNHPRKRIRRRVKRSRRRSKNKRSRNRLKILKKGKSERFALILYYI